MRQLLALAVAAAFAVQPAWSDVGGAPPPRNVSFVDKTLAMIPEDVLVKDEDVCFSFTGRSVAYRGVKNGKFHVFTNNRPGPAYAAIAEAPAFVRDGKTVVYRATQGTQWHVVIGGRPGPTMSVVKKPVFAPDFSRFAYEGSRGTASARDKTAWQMYVDGKPFGGKYASLGPPRFSADGKVIAHTARIGKNTPGRAFHTVYTMVINGKPGSETDPEGKIMDAVFAPKGGNCAYRRMDLGMWSMFINHKPGEKYLLIGKPSWSPDGKTLAYWATPDRKNYFVIQGDKKHGPFAGQNRTPVGNPVWSPDSKYIAFKLVKDGGWHIWANGKLLDPYPAVTDPVISRDGKSIAFGAIHPRKWTVIHDGKAGPDKLDALYGPPVISPDGKHVAYQASWKYKWIIVVDDAINEIFDKTEIPVWSPQSDKVAYAARKDGKHYMVVHYRRQEPFDHIFTPPVWSKDGKKVAFGARKDRALVWRVIDASGR